MLSSTFTAPLLATSTWGLPPEKLSMQKGKTKMNNSVTFAQQPLWKKIIIPFRLETWLFVFRLSREAEERRRRLTSHRLLQPRTTASIRNRYLCKVFNDDDDNDDNDDDDDWRKYSQEPLHALLICKIFRYDLDGLPESPPKMCSSNIILLFNRSGPVFQVILGMEHFQ